MKQSMNYSLVLRPLMEDEGGGWLVSFPDLPGCLSDGETPEEALANGKDALSAWLRAAEETGREIPHPGEMPSGKFTTRVPRTLHACLAARARQEGVSMNALVSTLSCAEHGPRGRIGAVAIRSPLFCRAKNKKLITKTTMYPQEGYKVRGNLTRPVAATKPCYRPWHWVPASLPG
uniref:Predicted nuclease of the RNAse H fold, HicB family n=1 Tax=Candidatus Kentrum sp. DK TaxID=2126562 RepID=A0A450SW47_9GAMM|nr:MAG: Predicted nuclease of the RNAse H fold, HicB family [Candidatus Kentron sp. DK]